MNGKERIESTKFESRAEVLEALSKKRDLAGADLCGLDLSGIKLFGVTMAGAKLRAANLTGSILRSLKNDTLIALCLLAVGILTILLGFIPVLALLPLAIGAFVGGFTMVDLPLALMQTSFRDRLRIAFSHKLELIAMGVLFGAIMLVPLGAVIFLAPSYGVGVRQLAKWKASG